MRCQACGCGLSYVRCKCSARKCNFLTEGDLAVAASRCGKMSERAGERNKGRTDRSILEPFALVKLGCAASGTCRQRARCAMHSRGFPASAILTRHAAIRKDSNAPRRIGTRAGAE